MKEFPMQLVNTFWQYNIKLSTIPHMENAMMHLDSRMLNLYLFIKYYATVIIWWQGGKSEREKWREGGKKRGESLCLQSCVMENNKISKNNLKNKNLNM